MNPFDYIKALNHHAYFIYSFKDGVEKLKDFLNQELDITSSKNPDFYYEKFDVLGIDEARKIKELHKLKSFAEGNKRIFIIEASGITHEAQNSLLKTFEEPNVDSIFFLIMPTPEVLLPTLCSRLLINRSGTKCDETIDVDSGSITGEIKYLAEAEKFLKLSKKDKVAFVDEIAKKISDEKANKSDAQEFLVALEFIVYKREGLKNIRGIEAVLKAKDYMNDRSLSIKQLLEFVALSI